LTNNHRKIEEYRRVQRLARKRRQPQLELHPRRVDDILDAYFYDPDLVPGDCQHMLRLRHTPGCHIDEDRVLALRSHPRFLAWLELNQSSLLLVDANSEPAVNPEMSSVSARLYQHVFEMANRDGKSAMLIPLAFFCRSHSDYENDENGTPSELAMSLLLQLLDTWRDIDPTVLSEILEGLEPEDAASVCAALGRALSRLPINSIAIVIIDGLRYFAHPRERRNKLIDLVERLVSMHREGFTATVKFLFANSARCEYLEHIVTGEEYLKIPKDVASGGGHNPLTWEWPDPGNESTLDEIS
jgi:hypothetical protein